MSNPLLRLSHQNEATWASFHRRIAGIIFDYSKMFSEPVFNFLDKKAQALGSSIGYVVPSLLTSTSYLLAANWHTLAATQPVHHDGRSPWNRKIASN